MGVRQRFTGVAFAMVMGSAVVVTVGAPPAGALTGTGAIALATTCTTSNTCALTPIEVSSGTVENGIALPEEGYQLAITPNGRTAFVTGGGGGDHVVPVSLSSDTSGKTIDTMESGSIAIAPNGATAYVIAGQQIVPINTSTDAQGSAIAGPNAFPANGGLAVSPDGSTVYVDEEALAGSGSDIQPIATSDGSLGASIPVTNNGELTAFAVTPDGSTLFATDPTTDTVYPIDLSSQVVGSPITLSHSPQAVAVTPDGSTALVADTDGYVTSIDTGTDSVAGSVDACPTGSSAVSITVTPDGSTALVACNAGTTSSDVTPIAVSSLSVGTRIPIPSSQTINGIVALPDQAPSAFLSVTPGSGSSATLSASAGAGEYPIGTYSWVFGDGDTAVTSTPTVTHTYASPGDYTATVTETDGAGTSTSEVFTGQTVSRNGGPSAASSGSIEFDVSPCEASNTCQATASLPGQTVSVSGTPSDTGASLSLDSGSGFLPCSPKGFNVESPLFTLTAQTFTSGQNLTVTDVLDDVTKSEAKHAAVCFEGTSSPAANLATCSPKVAAPCLESKKLESGNLDMTMEVPPNDPRFHTVQITTIDPTNFTARAKPGNVITITGTGLSGATAVSFSGPSNTWLQGVIGTNTATKITATVPTNAVTGPIQITWPSATFESTTNLTIT